MLKYVLNAGDIISQKIVRNDICHKCAGSHKAIKYTETKRRCI